MNSMTEEQISVVTQELFRLRRAVAQAPCPWSFGRIAELEGVLAAYREERAWATTRGILEKLRTPA